MFLLDGTWVASATDLTVALRCEYQLLHRRAEKAGLVEPLVVERDAMLAKAAELGYQHEGRALERLVEAFGPGPRGVVEIAQPSTSRRSELEAAHAACRACSIVERGRCVGLCSIGSSGSRT